MEKIEQPIIDVKRLGHLGIIAAIFKEYKIVELIDSLLPKPGNHQFVTHGEAILAMVMQGLGFSNHRLYLSAEFFSHVAIEGLFSKKVKAEHFTSEVFVGTLDAVFKYEQKGLLRNDTFLPEGLVLFYLFILISDYRP